MTQLICIYDYNFINKHNSALVFTIDSNVKQICENKNIEYYDYYVNNILDIDIDQVKNNKISILDEFDEEGINKKTPIYHDNFDELIDNLEKQMKIIKCRNGNGYIHDVKVSTIKKQLLDSSVIYIIGCSKIIDNDTGEDITNMFRSCYSLITDVSIIDFH